LGRQAIAVCDQIRAVDKTRLLKLEGDLFQKDIDALDEGLKQVLSLFFQKNCKPRSFITALSIFIVLGA
jgi:hypothetical protein